MDHLFLQLLLLVSPRSIIDERGQSSVLIKDTIEYVATVATIESKTNLVQL